MVATPTGNCLVFGSRVHERQHIGERWGTGGKRGIGAIRLDNSRATGCMRGGNGATHEDGYEDTVCRGMVPARGLLMSTPVLLNHRTSYRYDRMVSLGPQTIRLRPPVHMRNAIMTYALTIGPDHAGLTWRQDTHGNVVSEVSFSERMALFTVDVSMIVDLAPYDPLATLSRAAGMAPHHEPDYRRPVVAAEVLAPFLEADDPSPAETHLARLTTLARRIATRLHYMRRLAPGVWTPQETLAREAGSCRDSAWLLIALARHLGYAARFVSGYLIEPSALQADPDRLVCDLHAWAEIWVPEHGWVGFDTTSGRLAAQNHIPLAASDTPEDAAPISGLLDQCQAEFDVLMQAHFLHRDDRREPKP